MRVLALDTATETCAVALCDGDHLLHEILIDRRETHARHIMSLIDSVMGASSVKPADLDGLAVVRGPGSFTGLRIGIATAKGLALAWDKPLTGISSLQALATALDRCAHPICPWIDARRSEVYAARYRWQDAGLIPEMPECVGTPESLLQRIDGPTLFLGSGALRYRDLIQSRMGQNALFPFPWHHAIRAASVAQLGMDMLSAGLGEEPGRLTPHYIRQSDAELFSLRK